MATENFEKACGLFLPSYEALMVTDAILCQINILRHKMNRENKMEKVLNVSESLKFLVLENIHFFQWLIYERKKISQKNKNTLVNI